jgi:hypothetical protein
MVDVAIGLPKASGVAQTDTGAIQPRPDQERPHYTCDPRLLRAPGGTARLRDPLYIRRAPDDEAEVAAGRTGETLVIKAPRQMGKSSLAVRYLAACRDKEKAVAYLDFQLLGEDNLGTYASLLRAVASGILDELDLGDLKDGTVPEGDLTGFVERRVLRAVAGEVAIVFDEVDRILGRPYRQDFFAMLRGWHNRRASHPDAWEKLDLALVIPTEPYLLIDRADQSPFNVVTPLSLEPLSRDQMGQLNSLHGGVLNTGELDHLHALVGGQPYLSRLALYRLNAEPRLTFSQLDERAADPEGPFGEHLRSLLLRLQGRSGLLDAMRQVVRHGTTSDDDTTHRLFRAGLTRHKGKRIVPTNLLYAPFFSRTQVSARKEHASGAFRLQVGGTLSPRRHVYIERREDKEALHLLLAGEYVNILSSRQMGKSSLMVRVKRELNARGVRVATVDLASDVGAPPQADSFYLTLLKSIGDELELNVVFGDWWRERSSDTVNRRFLDFFQTIALSRVDGPVVVFLDEIDSTLRLLYTDDLFTAIRGMYNRRATTTAFERLTFCLVGVATPNELIKDARTTSYNVGATIELRDFDASRDDLSALAVHLDPDPETGLALLDRVLHWTDGHPYITVKLCAELAATVAKTGEDVDRYVEAAFTSLDRLGGEPHFLQILRFLKTRLANSLSTLSLYRRIISGRREPDQRTMAHAQLKLSGLVKRDNVDRLIVRNEIYRRLFDAKWAAAEISALQGHVDLAAMRVLVSSIDGEADL